MAHLAALICSSFRRRPLWGTVATFCVALGLGAGITAYCPIYRSHRLLAEVGHLHVGVSDYSETERIARLLNMQVNPEVPCSIQECLWRINIDNGYLPSSWRGDKTEMTAGLRVESNQLVSTDFGFVKVHEPDFIGVQWFESIPSLWKTHSAADVAYRSDLSGKFLVSIINVSPSASEEEKQKYLAFNLKCFWLYHGCNDAFEFLPVLRSDPRLQRQH